MFLSLSGVCSFNTNTTAIVNANVNASVLKFHFDEANEAICLIPSIRSDCNSSQRSRFQLNFHVDQLSQWWELIFLMQYNAYHFVTWITARFFHFLLLSLQFVVFATAAAAAPACYSFSLRTLSFRKNNSVHTSWLVFSTKPDVLKFFVSLINGIKLNMLLSH